jgi:hypothetical protein
MPGWKSVRARDIKITLNGCIGHIGEIIPTKKATCSGGLRSWLYFPGDYSKTGTEFTRFFLKMAWF